MAFTIENAAYTNQALMVFLNLLRGGVSASEYSPTFIDIGIGGNFLNGSDQHHRVPPDPTEIEIRTRIFRARVVGTRIISDTEIAYTAMIEPHECINSGINEMALVTSNNTMISHWIAPAIGGDPANECITISKSGYVYFFIEWKVKLSVKV